MFTGRSVLSSTIRCFVETDVDVNNSTVFIDCWLLIRRTTVGEFLLTGFDFPPVASVSAMICLRIRYSIGSVGEKPDFNETKEPLQLFFQRFYYYYSSSSLICHLKFLKKARCFEIITFSA